jgi:surface antigen
MIFGGATGAALSRDLGCEDRYFVYRTYYGGFDRGRPGAEYPWRNPRTGLYGTLIVGDYYRDVDNYRCATYTQEIFVRGRREFANGHACRQDDGTWVMID